MKVILPSSWKKLLAGELRQPYFQKLARFVDRERQEYTVYPPEEEVFAALDHTPYPKANVLILGQDPYHDANQAHGLAFSVRPGVPLPPSLRNIFKELQHDVGCPLPNNGCLIPWADQGVLLLNAVLTVRAHEPNSHRNKGWERFTDAVIRRLNERNKPVVFVLWGGNAQRKLPLLEAERHTILRSAHPSPLSAKNGFFGSKPFSAVNRALRAGGEREIDWCIPDL